MSQNEPTKKRRAKKFLSPSQKYEIWLQMVRGEATVAEIAASCQGTAGSPRGWTGGLPVGGQFISLPAVS